jgi:hypothetical protein
MRHRRRRLGVVSASASSSSDVSSRVVSSCVGAWMLHRVPSSLSRCDTSTHLRARLSRPRDPLSTTRKLGVNPTTINQPTKPPLNQPRASVETETYIDLILHVVSRHAVRVAGWEEDIEELVGIGLCAAWTLVDGLTRAGADGGGSRVGRAHDDVDSRGRGNVGCGRGA